MNRHRLYRPSKKIQGRRAKKEESKLDLNKSVKRGAGLKVVNEAKLEAILGKKLK